jgi:hypothetical protein
MHRSRIDYKKIISAAELPPAALQAVEVLTGLDHMGSNLLQSSDRWCPLPDFMDSLPEDTKPTAGAGSRGQKEHEAKDSLIRLMPWLQNCWKETDARFQEDVSSRSGSGACKAGKVVPEELDDETLQEVFAELDRRRSDLAADGAVYALGEDFKVGGLGGAWTYHHHGVAMDAIQASCRHQAAKTFCDQHHLPKSARFDLKAFPDGIAQVLARAWAHRMQFFYDLGVAIQRDGAAFRPFSPDEQDSYQETAEFRTAAGELGGHRQGIVRVNQIRALFS